MPCAAWSSAPPIRFIPPSSAWSDLSGERAFPSRLLFANHELQGCYNAALVHLAEANPGHRAEYILKRMVDYGWTGKEASTSLPPIWISIVGSNGQMIPVTVVSPTEYSRAAEEHQAEKAKEHPAETNYLFARGPISPNDQPLFGKVNFPDIWFLLFLVFLVLNVFCFLEAWVFLRKSDWTDKPADLCSLFKQRTHFSVLCLAQILFYGQIAELASTPLLSPRLYGEMGSALAAWFVELTSLGMVLLAGGCLLWEHRRLGTATTDATTTPTAKPTADAITTPTTKPTSEATTTSRPTSWPWSLSAMTGKRLLGLFWLLVLPLGLAWESYSKVIRHPKSMSGLPARPVWLFAGGFWIVVADILSLLLVIGVMICFACRIWVAMSAGFDVQRVIDFERIVHMANGVSPLLPRLFFCTALFAWGFFLVKKLHLANRYAVACPFPSDGLLFTQLNNQHEEVRAELMPPSTIQKHFWLCVGALAFLTAVFVKHFNDSIPPVDGLWFNRITIAGFFICSFLLAFTLLQFSYASASLRRLLRFLAQLPMQNAFERLSAHAVTNFHHYLFSIRSRNSHLTLLVKQFQLLARLFPDFRKQLQAATQAAGELSETEGEEQAHPSHGPLSTATQQSLSAAWAEVQKQFPPEQLAPTLPDDNAANNEKWSKEGDKQSPVLARACLAMLRHFWPDHSMEAAFGQPPSSDQKGDSSRIAPTLLCFREDSSIRLWVRAAEDFVALETVRYLSQFIVQLRNLLWSLTIGSLLLLLAAVAYPFFPQSQLLLVLTCLGGTAVVVIVSFLIHLNRDELISRITHTTPNRFSLDLPFIHGTATFVLPIVAGLMVQFPWVTGMLRSLIEPLFHIVH